MGKFVNEEELRRIIDEMITGAETAAELEELISERVKDQLANRTKIEEVTQDILENKKKELGLYKQQNAEIGETLSLFGSLQQSLRQVVQAGGQGVIDMAMGIKDGLAGAADSAKQMGGKLASLGKGKTGALLAGGVALGFLAVTKQIVDQFIKIDEAASKVVKETGILSDSMDTALIKATERADLLGGNISKVGEFAVALVDQFSPAVEISGKLIGDVAELATRFGFSVDNASKLTRIIADKTNVAIDKAGDRTRQFVEQLGAFGPAITRNIVESYETVNNQFALGIKQIEQQAVQATNLGITLEDAAEVSKGLLDIGSSITAEFKASALLGEQLNLQRARQLAFEGNIVEANNEILNQVSKIGDLSKLNTFQAQAIEEATGKTVTELERELNIRRNIGGLEERFAAQRENVLDRWSEISARISSAFFEVVSDPRIQNRLEDVATAITEFLRSEKFASAIDSIESFVGIIGDLLSGTKQIEFNLFTPWQDTIQISSPDEDKKNNFKTKSQAVGDAIIDPSGRVVSTDPMDYIITTKTPGAMANAGNGGQSRNSDRIMEEMVTLLRDLKQNGVKAGDTYLDGRKVSKGIAGALR